MRITRIRVRGQLFRIDGITRQVGLVHGDGAAQARRRRGTQVTIHHEVVRLRQRRHDHDQLRDVCNYGLARATQAGTRQYRTPREHFYGQDFVVRAVELAAHAIAADDGELAARRSGTALLSIRIAHQQMATEGRNDFRVEFFGSVARVHSAGFIPLMIIRVVSRHSICRAATIWSG